MNKLLISDKHIRIQIDMTEPEINKINQLKELGVTLHANRKGNEYTVSPRYIKEVFEVFERDINAAPLHIFKVYEKWTSLPAKLEEAKSVDAYFDESHFLMKHQQMGRRLAKEFDKFGFFYSVRAGKTPLLLQIIADNPTDKWLIVCPLVLIDNAWLEDANRFFPGMKIVKLHAATKAKRMKQFQEDANVYIINTESFAAYEEDIRKLGITGVVLDESSSLKNPTSKFSKCFTKYCNEIDKTYLLSGTPAPNGMHEYYKQLQCLDPYIVPSSYTRFKQEYFVNTSYNPQFEILQIRRDKEQDLKDLIAKVSIYVDAQDYFEFPGRSFETINIPMPDDLKVNYNQMAKELYTEVAEDNQITAPSAAAKLNKLRQISSGFIYNEDGQATLLSMFKFNRLLELLNTIGDEQVLIWANYKYEFEVIQSLLGDRCRIVNGSVNIVEKNTAIKMFKERKIQYLIANPASADKGLTLTNAHICIYFSIGYSYELYHQSVARIYGGKHSQPKFCNYYMFEVDNSLDRTIYKAVDNKENVSLEILNYIRVRGGQ